MELFEKRAHLPNHQLDLSVFLSPTLCETVYSLWNDGGIAIRASRKQWAADYKAEMWRANSLSWLSLGEGEIPPLAISRLHPAQLSFQVYTPHSWYLRNRRGTYLRGSPSLLTRIQLPPQNVLSDRP